MGCSVIGNTTAFDAVFLGSSPSTPANGCLPLCVWGQVWDGEAREPSHQTERYRSGQTGQAVNLLAKPSEVQILLSPHLRRRVAKNKLFASGSFWKSAHTIPFYKEAIKITGVMLLSTQRDCKHYAENEMCYIFSRVCQGKCGSFEYDSIYTMDEEGNLIPRTVVN